MQLVGGPSSRESHTRAKKSASGMLEYKLLLRYVAKNLNSKHWDIK